MNRNLITWAGIFVAALSLTLASADVEARQCRSRHRNRCCRQTSNCGYQQATNCGNGCGQTARYAPTTTACCTQQSSFGSETPTSGTLQPAAYDTPTSAGDPIQPRPIVTPTAPAPGA
jgi:hypothetical protein